VTERREIWRMSKPATGERWRYQMQRQAKGILKMAERETKE